MAIDGELTVEQLIASMLDVLPRPMGFRCRWCWRFRRNTCVLVARSATRHDHLHTVVAKTADATSRNGKHRWCLDCVRKLQGVDQALRVAHRLEQAGNPPPPPRNDWVLRYGS